MRLEKIRRFGETVVIIPGRGIGTGRFGLLARRLMLDADLKRPSDGPCGKVQVYGGKGYIVNDWRFKAMTAGRRMEQLDTMLRATTDELKESKAVVETLANQVAEIADVIHPKLDEQARRLRTARMTLVSETQQAMTALRDVKDVFRDREYEAAMRQIESFVRLAQELKRLKDEGVLDAIVDVAIRLAVKEEHR